MRVSIEKPFSPEEILEHHGVKGMHWGQRHAQNVQATRSATAKFYKKNPTNADRARTIQRARGNNIKNATDFRTEKNKTKKANLKKAFLKNPDRATALRFSRGEKIVAGLLVGSVVAAPETLAIVGARVAIRKHIEKKQARGGYN